MKARFGRALVAVLSVAALAVGLSSCSWLMSLFNSNTDPTVSLSAYDTTLYSDDIASFTASGYDADGDSLTYDWYINGTLLDVHTSEISRYWLNSSTIYPEVYVIVDDGYGGTATSNTVTMTITAAASFRVINNTGASIYYIRTSTNSGATWSADYLGSYTLPTGYNIRITGLSDSYFYRIRAFDSTGDYWDSGSGGVDVSMWDGYYRNFTLTASSWSMSTYMNTSLAAPPALDLGGATGTKQASIAPLAPKALDAAAFNPQIAPISAEESDPNHEPALGFGVRF
jgi:hypothetical protein